MWKLLSHNRKERRPYVLDNTWENGEVSWDKRRAEIITHLTASIFTHSVSSVFLRLLCMWEDRLIFPGWGPGHPHSTFDFDNINVTLGMDHLVPLQSVTSVTGDSCNCQQWQSQIWPTGTFCWQVLHFFLEPTFKNREISLKNQISSFCSKIGRRNISLTFLRDNHWPEQNGASIADVMSSISFVTVFTIVFLQHWD